MKTDKTDIFFNEMYKEISKTELHYDFKVKEVLNNKHLDNEEINKMISLINLEKEDAIRDIKVEHTSNAINEGYNKTTQHISMILDLDPNFCTRHIKEYIDFIRIPSGTSDLFKSYKKFNVIEQVEFSKKKLLFNTDSLYKFIKENLYEVDKFVPLKINNLSNIVKKPEDIYYCEKLAQEFISKITKENEYRTPITEDQLNEITSDKITLLRQDSLKQLVSKLILNDKLISLIRKLEADFEDKDESEKQIQEEILSGYANKIEMMDDIKEILVDFHLLKLGNMTHQTQITRSARNLQHTRYHLLLPGRKQAINLYGVKAGEIEMPTVNDPVKNDTSSIKVIISVHSLYENIEEDIYKYIEKNINKARKNKDI